MVFRLLERLPVGALVYRESSASDCPTYTPCVVVHTDERRRTVTVQNREGAIEEVTRDRVTNRIAAPTDRDLDLQAMVVADLIRARRITL